jgi:DNA-binding CsgD family transcriptional regulator
MPRRSASDRPDESQGPASISLELRRIARLLALIAVKGETQSEKIVTLSAAGFAAAEVAELLRTTPNAVAVAVYQNKRKTRSVVRSESRQ